MTPQPTPGSAGVTGYEPTSELIEAAERVLYANDLVPGSVGDLFERAAAKRKARAVLAVVVPLIREQIAAEIEAQQQAGRLMLGYAFGNETYNEGMRAAARVARGLDR